MKHPSEPIPALLWCRLGGWIGRGQGPRKHQRNQGDYEGTAHERVNSKGSQLCQPFIALELVSGRMIPFAFAAPFVNDDQSPVIIPTEMDSSLRKRTSPQTKDWQWINPAEK